MGPGQLQTQDIYRRPVGDSALDRASQEAARTRRGRLDGCPVGRQQQRQGEQGECPGGEQCWQQQQRRRRRDAERTQPSGVFTSSDGRHGRLIIKSLPRLVLLLVWTFLIFRSWSNQECLGVLVAGSSLVQSHLGYLHTGVRVDGVGLKEGCRDSYVSGIGVQAQGW
jgi:hypothetical protein